MTRALTSVLVDLEDAPFGVALAENLRLLGFRAAATTDSVPSPRRPALVVTDHERSDAHLQTRGGSPLPGLDSAAVLLVDTPAPPAGEGPSAALFADARARELDSAVAQVVPHADAVTARIDTQRPPELQRLSTAEVLAAVAPFEVEPVRELVPGAPRWSVVVLTAYELPRVRARFGPQATDDLLEVLAQCVYDDVPGVHLLGATERDELVLVADRRRMGKVSRQLETVVRRLHERRYTIAAQPLETSDSRTLVGHQRGEGDDEVRLTPLVGYAGLQRGERSAYASALLACATSRERLDLEPTAGPAQLGEREVAAALGERALDEPGETTAGRTFLGRARALTSRPGARLWTQAVLTILIGAGVPYLAYSVAARNGVDLTAFTYPIVVVALVLTALAIVVESMLALEPTQPEPVPDGARPAPASAIIAAYLPNESATILSTLEAFRRVEYEGGLQIILAYNTPTDLPVEASLRELAGSDDRILLLRVPDSTSKAQNVNAALEHVTGELVGIFDADHHPAPNSFDRAWQWLRSGTDVVQGHCVVRNGSASTVARLVAVEFESIYAVSHPGRAQLHGFGIFGGSNGYWRTEVLREVRMRRRMLTEDIDSSVRALTEGYRIASDPRLVSYELATTTLGQLTAQRLRWAQGWLQVSVQRLADVLRSPHLTARQKAGATYLLAWREVYPWMSLQMYPILLFALAHRGAIQHHSWFISLFVASTVLTLGIGPLQTWMAYLLGAPSIRQERRWFWHYLVLSGLFTELKSALTRISHIKELQRERVWRVTPRQIPATAGTPQTEAQAA